MRWFVITATAITGSLLGVAAAPAAEAIACVDLAQRITRDQTEIIEAQALPAEGQSPAHCLLRGRVNPRIGSDGRSYAIRFELRLPDAWNGRFLHQLNGGNDGVVVPALGDPRNLNAVGHSSALSRGFAVLSSDSGHDGSDPANAAAKIAAGNMFGLDPQARRDYGYAADVTLAPIARAVIALRYGRPPDHSYMFGCSNGGRHAMVGAVRLAAAYDGFIAGNPGFNLPKAAVQHAWDIQNFRRVHVDVKKAFSPADMALVAGKVREACDALDGAADGMVNDLRQCQKIFRLDTLQCRGENTAACLGPAQVTALERSFAGPRNSAGEPLYADWPFDAGIGARNWRFWKLESAVPAWDNNPLIATMGAGSLAQIFTTPPTRIEGTPDKLIDFLAQFDFDRDAPKIFATDVTYAESAMDFMTPPDAADPRLAALRAAGHKLLVYHGASDGVFSVNDTINWYERLTANVGDAADSARLFVVPGMNHCSSGPATDTFDALGAMVAWVEEGKTPERIIATVAADNKELPPDWSRTRSRPLCPWPHIARFTGGDLESAESFVCAPP